MSKSQEQAQIIRVTKDKVFDIIDCLLVRGASQ